ncbi:MAG TPA: LPS biosynthesis protein [Myxococcales bacterium]|nr:LPS biosynthesis protein [Myxococcales bacterium]
MNRDAERPQNSFLDMLYARLGKGICEKFLVPYNEKLYACALDTLDVDAMGRFFPHADVDEIIANFTRPKNQSYNATFSYPKGGAIEYVNALLHDLPTAQISYNEALVSIDLDTRTATTTQRQIRFENLVSAVPFPHMLHMAGLDVDDNIYTWNKVLVFNLGFDRKGWTGDHWLYIPSSDISFYRVGFYDNIFGHDRMSLYIEIGMDRHEEVGSVDAHRARVLADLETLGITHNHQLVSSHSVVLDPAYVHITKASQADFERRSNQLHSHGVYSIGRYGGWTYCSIEDNMIEARQLAQSLG